jgi:hypothetical protein
MATHTLAQLGGGATYLLTVAEQLQRTGHQITLYGVEQGRAAEIALERGLAVAGRPEHLPADVDAIVSQDHDVALQMRKRYPDARHAFVVHSELLDINAPPQLPDVVGAVVVLHDRMRRHVEGLANRPPVVRLTQPVDVERFASRQPPRDRLERVMLLGNYHRSERRLLVESVCRELGVECCVVGFHTETTERPELAMNDADVVIGKDRVIIEAMACGRAAYVYDLYGGDGWVTPERYEGLEGDNFGGTAFGEVVTRERLLRDLAEYDAAMGLANRDLVNAHHNAIHHVDRLVGVLESLSAAPIELPRALDELARLVRVAWQHEARAHHHSFEVEVVRERAALVERERDAALERAARATADAANAASAERDARAWLAQAEDRLRQAEFLEAETTAFRQTSRYRLANALASPVDVVRCRIRGGRRSSSGS